MEIRRINANVKKIQAALDNLLSMISKQKSKKKKKKKAELI